VKMYLQREHRIEMGGRWGDTHSFRTDKTGCQGQIDGGRRAAAGLGCSRTVSGALNLSSVRFGDA
jgi:hypothetical protein